MNTTDVTTLISIVMPAYNVSAFIEDSIDSVLNQTYTNWELIVVDDGSTDTTAEIVSRKSAQDCRIKYYYQENGRQAKARNTGLMYVKGELIAFLDADDLWLKDKLKIMVNEFRAGNQDLLFSDSYIFENSFSADCINPNCKRMGVDAAEYSGFDGLSDFLEMNRVPMLSVVGKSDVIKKYRFNEIHTPAEDYDLWLRMLVGGCRLRSISLPLTAYRLHQDSSTSSDRLVIDTVIEIIYQLKCSNNNKLINNLMESKLKKWLLRKLQTVENNKQLEQFMGILCKFKFKDNIVVCKILYNINNSIFKINRRLLNIILK